MSAGSGGKISHKIWIPQANITYKHNCCSITKVKINHIKVHFICIVWNKYYLKNTSLLKTMQFFFYTKCRLMILADQKRKRRGIPSPGLSPWGSFALIPKATLHKGSSLSQRTSLSLSSKRSITEFFTTQQKKNQVVRSLGAVHRFTQRLAGTRHL